MEQTLVIYVVMEKGFDHENDYYIKQVGPFYLKKETAQKAADDLSKPFVYKAEQEWKARLREWERLKIEHEILVKRKIRKGNFDWNKPFYSEPKRTFIVIEHQVLCE